MILTQTVEWIDRNDEEQYLEVDFECFPKWEDNSYDDEYGTVYVHPIVIIDEDIAWDDKLYSHQENTFISLWLNEHYDKVEDQFCEAFRKSITNI